MRPSMTTSSPRPYARCRACWRCSTSAAWRAWGSTRSSAKIARQPLERGVPSDGGLRRLAEVEQARTAGHDEHLDGVAGSFQALGDPRGLLRKRQRIVRTVNEQHGGANVFRHVVGRRQAQTLLELLVVG